MLRWLLPVAVFLCGCERAPTPAEGERQLLPVVLRYAYEHGLTEFPNTSTKTIFVGTPADDSASDSPKGMHIQRFYSDPSPEWLSAFAASGISVRPASRAEITYENPFYFDPQTRQRVVVFAIHQITFSDEQHASVLTPACMAPLGGGETTYYLARERDGWHVTRSAFGAVY